MLLLPESVVMNYLDRKGYGPILHSMVCEYDRFLMGVKVSPGGHSEDEPVQDVGHSKNPHLSELLASLPEEDTSAEDFE